MAIIVSSKTLISIVTTRPPIDGLQVRFEQATPEQIGMYLPTTRKVGAGSVSVRYKVSTSSTWLNAHPLLRISTTGNEAYGPTTIVDAFAGSIFDLQPGTTYDVELTHIEAGQPNKVTTFQRTTRSLPLESKPANVTATTTDNLQTKFNSLKAGDVLQLADGTYNFSGLTVNNSGTLTSPVTIRGATRAGVVLKNPTGIVLTISASHFVLENLTIEGSNVDSGPLASSIGIRIRNAQTNITIRQIDMRGIDQGIIANPEQTGALVYENSLQGNNLWTAAFADTNITWGDDGITLPGYGNCAFNNTLKGFGDTFAFATSTNDSLYSEGNYAYRNIIRNSGDDTIEFDYCTRNIGFYDNLIVNCGTAMSMS